MQQRPSLPSSLPRRRNFQPTHATTSRNSRNYSCHRGSVYVEPEPEEVEVDFGRVTGAQLMRESGRNQQMTDDTRYVCRDGAL